MLETVNLQEVKKKLYEKLKDTGWDIQLKSMFIGQDFDKILSALFEEAIDGKRFTPPLKNVFSALEKCHFKDTKVVFIGMDPYPQMGIANGLAFCCAGQTKAQPSLEFMLNAIKETVNPDYIYRGENSINLDRWAEQGVLLLNSAFTTTINKPGSHHLIWKNFIVNLLDRLIWENPNLIYVFFGKKAQELMPIIPDNNGKISVSHPASAGYRAEEKWDCENLFNRVNETLKAQNKNIIIW